MPTVTPTSVPSPQATAEGAPAQGQQGQMSARDRAIAKLMQGSQAQPTPVPNPTSVSPEEVSAITSQTTPTDRQSHITESTEATPAEATPSKEDPLSPQFAQLARKEKALRMEMQKLKAEREAFKTEREAASKVAQPEQPAFDPSKYIPKERLLQDTLGTLMEQGIDYEKLAEMALNQQAPVPAALQNHISKLEAKIAELEKATTTTQKSIQDAQDNSYKQAVNQIRNEAKQLVASDPDTYETIRTSGAVDDVVDLIEKTFKEEGILLTVEDAAKAVEDHLAEEAFKYTQLKKIQNRLKPAAPAQAAPATQQPQAKQPQTTPSKTLTNAVGTTRQLSARERAILAFKGELKS